MELVAVSLGRVEAPVRSATFAMSRLTAIVGGNDTGKTTLLRALHDCLTATAVVRSPVDDDAADLAPELDAFTLFFRVDRRGLEVLFEDCLRDLTGLPTNWPPPTARTWLNAPFAPSLDPATESWVAAWPDMPAPSRR